MVSFYQKSSTKAAVPDWNDIGSSWPIVAILLLVIGKSKVLESLTGITLKSGAFTFPIVHLLVFLKICVHIHNLMTIVDAIIYKISLVLPRITLVGWNPKEYPIYELLTFHLHPSCTLALTFLCRRPWWDLVHYFFF